MKRTKLYRMGLACLLGLCLVTFFQDKEKNKTVQASLTLPKQLAATLAYPISSNKTESPNKIEVDNAELRKLSDWVATRGLPTETSLSSNGEIVSRSAHTGYEFSSEAVLRQFATSGDKMAAMVLAEKLRGRIQTYAVPPSPELKEVIDLLQMATMRGYTNSIDELAFIKLAQYQKIGVASNGKARPSTRAALLEAYEYAYLNKMRGEIVPDNLLSLVKRIERITPAEDLLAQKGATVLYEKMHLERTALGLPAFNNVIPQDVHQTMHKLLQLQNLPQAK
jgi:hypothetical protein